MKAHSDVTNELIKDIRKIKKNLDARIRRIESDSSLSQYAVSSYKDFLRRNADRLSNLSDVEDDKLRTLYRDISYINKLRTSTVEGAKSAGNLYTPIKEKMQTLSKPLRTKVKEAFDKLYELPSMHDKFKYENLEIIVDRIYSGEDVETIIAELSEAYMTNVYEPLEGDIYGTEGSREENRNRRKLGKLLTSKTLQELRDKIRRDTN